MTTSRRILLTAITALTFLFAACSEDSTTTTPPENDNQEQPGTDNPNDDNDEDDSTSEKVEKLLTGRVIGTMQSVDYSTGQASTTVNNRDMVFDKNYDTYFASYERSGTWVGLDLGKKHVITKIGYSPRIEQSGRVVLAILEGANNADFSDALPIYIIKEAAKERMMTYGDVNCSRGFRYVRYVTPNNVRCNLAELEFYGIEDEGDDSHLFQLTNLPTVIINTQYRQDILSKENEIKSSVYIISENGTNLLSDTDAGVRGRGNASWEFPKKPYRIKFSEKRSPLGAPASAKKWTLINNYGDKTLMRNILAFELSRRLGMSYTPFCQPVDVILNGEYRGCYQLCDQIEVNKNRVNITAMKPGDTAQSTISGGYLIEIDAYAYSEESYFVSKKGIPVTIKSPDEDDIVAEQSKYITNFFNSMENAVFSPTFADEKRGYRQYLDLDSFLQHFIVGELAGNTDTYWSVYMYKDRNSDKLYTGPIWDHDLSFENDIRIYPLNNMPDFVYASSQSSAAHYEVRNMVNRIIKEDTQARDRLIEMWNEARKDIFTEESLIKYIEETAALLDESQKLNFMRWNILNQSVHQNVQAYGSYEAEVDVVKNYIKKRLPKMDGLINNR